MGKAHIIGRVFPRGRVGGRVCGRVGGLNHIRQVGVSIMTTLLWSLPKTNTKTNTYWHWYYSCYTRFHNGKTQPIKNSKPVFLHTQTNTPNIFFEAILIETLKL